MTIDQLLDQAEGLTRLARAQLKAKDRGGAIQTLARAIDHLSCAVQSARVQSVMTAQARYQPKKEIL